MTSDEIYRLTVSITKSLKDRMDRFKDDANWSRVAREAFEKELRIMEDTNKTLDPAVLLRLRVSKGNVEREGRNDGRAWAEQEAEWDQLHKLSVVFDDEKTDLDTDNPGRHVRHVLGYDSGGFSVEALDRGEFLAGKSLVYVEHFIQGALAVFATANKILEE